MTSPIDQATIIGQQNNLTKRQIAIIAEAIKGGPEGISNNISFRKKIKTQDLDEVRKEFRVLSKKGLLRRKGVRNKTRYFFKPPIEKIQPSTTLAEQVKQALQERVELRKRVKELEAELEVFQSLAQEI